MNDEPMDPDIWPPPVLPDYVLPARDWKALYAAEKLRQAEIARATSDV